MRRTILVGLASGSTNSRKQEIYSKWRILVIQSRFEVVDLLAQERGAVPHATDDSKAARIGHCSRELRSSGS